MMKILTCNSNRPLAEAISAYLGLPLMKASVRRFSDMETGLRFWWSSVEKLGSLQDEKGLRL